MTARVPVSDLPAQVVAQKPGFQTKAIEVRTRDAQQDYVIELQPIEWRFEVASVPEGATVYLDRREVGKAPCDVVVKGQPEGTLVTLRAAAGGFRSLEQTVSLNAELGKTPVKLDLQAADRARAVCDVCDLLRANGVADCLCNAPTGGCQSASDWEKVRADGKGNDVVVGRTGDQSPGTIKTAALHVKTALGELEVPSASVAWVEIADGQAVVRTTLGDIFFGALKEQQIAFQALGGKEENVSLANVQCLCYRKAEQEAPPPAEKAEAIVSIGGNAIQFASLKGELQLGTEVGVSHTIEFGELSYLCKEPSAAQRFAARMANGPDLRGSRLAGILGGTVRFSGQTIELKGETLDVLVRPGAVQAAPGAPRPREGPKPYEIAMRVLDAHPYACVAACSWYLGQPKLEPDVKTLLTEKRSAALARIQNDRTRYPALAAKEAIPITLLKLKNGDKVECQVVEQIGNTLRVLPVNANPPPLFLAAKHIGTDDIEEKTQSRMIAAEDLDQSAIRDVVVDFDRREPPLEAAAALDAFGKLLAEFRPELTEAVRKERSERCAACVKAVETGCATCAATGYVKCEKCEKGKLRVETTCPRCGGSHRLKCARCDGDGTVPCSRCKGTGEVTVKKRRPTRPGARPEPPITEEVKCPECGGSKKMRCTGCGGDGHTTCSRCNKDGKVARLDDCPDCAGKGQRPCATCGGTGQMASAGAPAAR